MVALPQLIAVRVKNVRLLSLVESDAVKKIVFKVMDLRSDEIGPINFYRFTGCII